MVNIRQVPPAHIIYAPNLNQVLTRLDGVVFGTRGCLRRLCHKTHTHHHQGSQCEDN